MPSNNKWLIRDKKSGQSLEPWHNDTHWPYSVMCWYAVKHKSIHQSYTGSPECGLGLSWVMTTARRHNWASTTLVYGTIVARFSFVIIRPNVWLQCALFLVGYLYLLARRQLSSTTRAQLNWPSCVDVPFVQHQTNKTRAGSPLAPSRMARIYYSPRITISRLFLLESVCVDLWISQCCRCTSVCTIRYIYILYIYL